MYVMKYRLDFRVFRLVPWFLAALWERQVEFMMYFT